MKKVEEGTLTLKQWMALNGVTCRAMADKLDCGITTVFNLCHGNIPEVLRWVREIEKITKKQVLLKNIVEHNEEKKQCKE